MGAIRKLRPFPLGTPGRTGGQRPLLVPHGKSCVAFLVAVTLAEHVL